MASQLEELIPGGYPTTPEHEKLAKYNAENSNIENNAAENNDIENKENNIGNKSAEESAEDKSTKDKSVEDKPVEDKSAEDKSVEDKNSKDKSVEDKNSKDKSVEDKNSKDKSVEDKIAEDKEKAVESFPLKFEPNPEAKPTDDNNLAKATTSKGSSALGGIGINPASLVGIGSDSPPHPFYHNKSQESDEPQPQTFDLNGDYNEQKEKEQIADKQDHEKDERIDLGVKPLGSQPLPSPYKPGENDKNKAPTGDTDRSVHKQTEEAKGETIPPSKTTAIHPESQNVGPRVTKKDKVNATISKAVGTFKEKVGKLIKNDNLVAKGTEKKAEADKTKELAEVQKKVNEI